RLTHSRGSIHHTNGFRNHTSSRASSWVGSTGSDDTFNNEAVIDRPVLAVHGDILVGLAVVPILCGFHVREFREDHSINRTAFKDFVLAICYDYFDRMTLHGCFDTIPIFFELFLIDGFSSR